MEPYEQYRINRAAALAAQEREAEERRRANEEARRAWLATLEKERALKRAAAEAQVEHDLAPERDRLKREWLAAHSGKTERDFIEHAWPQLRQNVIAERERRQIEATEALLRASGQYSF